VDIALAVGAGVHVGQDDMPFEIARTLLPPGTILGLSCNTIEEAKRAVDSGIVDYVGIGPIYDTNTKKPSKDKILGPRQAAKIVEVLKGTQVKSVAIGGIKSLNALRVLSGATSPNHHCLDGLAVVSELMASSEPKETARGLSDVIQAFKDTREQSNIPGSLALCSLDEYKSQQIAIVCGKMLDNVRKHRPVVHQVSRSV
jgi:thiamine-phosphate diphosphorylase/hydroxyethylthiazole kinase